MAIAITTPEIALFFAATDEHSPITAAPFSERRCLFYHHHTVTYDTTEEVKALLSRLLEWVGEGEEIVIAGRPVARPVPVEERLARAGKRGWKLRALLDQALSLFRGELLTAPIARRDADNVAGRMCYGKSGAPRLVLRAERPSKARL